MISRVLAIGLLMFLAGLAIAPVRVAAQSPSGIPCQNDTECSAPSRCLNAQNMLGPGNCRIGCTTNAQCPTGSNCGSFVNGRGYCSSAAPSAGGTPAPGAGGTVTLKNPLNVSSVPQLIGNIMMTAIGIVGALALLMFVYGGLVWLTSGGEPAKIQSGKDAMKWAAIGLIVIFSSYALVSFVFKAFTG